MDPIVITVVVLVVVIAGGAWFAVAWIQGLASANLQRNAAIRAAFGPLKRRFADAERDLALFRAIRAPASRELVDSAESALQSVRTNNPRMRALSEMAFPQLPPAPPTYILQAHWRDLRPVLQTHRQLDDVEAALRDIATLIGTAEASLVELHHRLSRLRDSHRDATALLAEIQTLIEQEQAAAIDMSVMVSEAKQLETQLLNVADDLNLDPDPTSPQTDDLEEAVLAAVGGVNALAQRVQRAHAARIEFDDARAEAETGWQAYSADSAPDEIRRLAAHALNRLALSAEPRRRRDLARAKTFLIADEQFRALANAMTQFLPPFGRLQVLAADSPYAADIDTVGSTYRQTIDSVLATLSADRPANARRRANPQEAEALLTATTTVRAATERVQALTDAHETAMREAAGLVDAALRELHAAWQALTRPLPLQDAALADQIAGYDRQRQALADRPAPLLGLLPDVEALTARLRQAQADLVPLWQALEAWQRELPRERQRADRLADGWNCLGESAESVHETIADARSLWDALRGGSTLRQISDDLALLQKSRADLEGQLDEMTNIRQRLDAKQADIQACLQASNTNADDLEPLLHMVDYLREKAVSARASVQAMDALDEAYDFAKRTLP